MNLKRLLLIALPCFISLKLSANYITIQNASVTGATSTTAQIQYDMFWENSWRDAVNWDAAWVFVKYNTGTGWQHATLSATGHVAGTASPTPVITVSSDFKGVFIYRSSVSSGLYNIQGQQVRWNFQADGLNQTQATTAQVRIYGIEMVYIPTGTFAIGDGNGVSESSGALWGGADNFAFAVSANMSPLISADAAMVNSTGAATSIRIHGTQGLDEDGDGIIDNPDYPLGFMHFYIMKYEISQGQYAEFLNTLTTTQANNRYYVTLQNRYTIANNSGVFAAGRPDRASNYMSWMDGAAYSDWACLRPLTETEYEKASRGPIAPVLNEYAWGTNTNVSYFTAENPMFTVAENGTETPMGTLTRNVHRTSTQINGGDGGTGPIRVGMNARVSTNRIQSASTYYGILNMTDNLIEPFVSIGNVSGRSYRGHHGDGALDTQGNANVHYWPGINGNSNANNPNLIYNNTTGVTNHGGGIMLKGDLGCNYSCNQNVSARNNSITTARNVNFGARFGRTAP